MIHPGGLLSSCVIGSCWIEFIKSDYRRFILFMAAIVALKMIYIDNIFASRGHEPFRKKILRK